MSFEQLVESRILEALDRGAFSGLAGEGKPLRLDGAEQIAGTLWVGYHLLENANMLPEWLELAKEIESRQADLRKADERHAANVELARRTGDWERLEPSIAACRRQYEYQARELRRRQDQYNIDAPGMAHERPGIWVEYHLECLDRRVAEARSGQPAA